MLYQPFETVNRKPVTNDSNQESFRPRITKPITENFVKAYMKEPERFSLSQARSLGRHAAFYGIPFRIITQEEADFDIFRALRYVGEGWIQGFSTLRVGDDPVNVWERVAKSVGMAAGYAGFVPGFGPLAGVARAVGGKSIPLLVSKAAMGKIAPTVLGMTERLAAEATLGGRGAVALAAKYLTSPVPRQIAYGMGQMGIAGATSSWQDGIDNMVRGFVGGSYMEFGDRLIANAMGAMIGGATGGVSAQAISRTLAGALWNGLPSTLRGETTPEQVYQYAIGAFFAHRDMPASEEYGRRFFHEGLTEARKNSVMDPEKVSDMPNWDKLDDSTKAVAERIFNSNIGTINARNFVTTGIIKKMGLTEEDLVDPDKAAHVRKVADELFAHIASLEAEKSFLDTKSRDGLEEINRLNEEQDRLYREAIVTPEDTRPAFKRRVVQVGKIKVFQDRMKPHSNTALNVPEPLFSVSNKTGEITVAFPDSIEDAFNRRTASIPSVYPDGSKSTPLPEDMWKTKEEMAAWGIAHELVHTILKQQEGETQGAFEDRTNLETMRVYTPLIEDVKQSELFSEAELDTIEQVFVGGFSNTGNGTPAGDGKDAAMREQADAFIGEIKELADVDFDTNEPERPSKSSSETSFWTIINKEGADVLSSSDKHSYSVGIEKPSVVMLARNSELKGNPLEEHTKESILTAHKSGARFVVGDMPDVDSQFVKYLREIGATYQIYHTGDKPRITKTGDLSTSWSRYDKNGYEVSTKGDSRFSALHAKLKDGRTIEEAYQLDVKGYRKFSNDWLYGKGKPPLDKSIDTYAEYKKLWTQWAEENPALMDELAQKANGKVLTDMMAKTDVSQARALSEMLNERNLEKEQQATPPKDHAMSYKVGASESIYKESTTTLKLAEEGKRTGTTRSYPLGKVGDRITFEGRPQVYVVTGVEKLTKENTSDPEWKKQWSEKEGWTVEHFEKALNDPRYRTVSIGSYQTSYVREQDFEKEQQAPVPIEPQKNAYLPRLEEAIKGSMVESSKVVIPEESITAVQSLGFSDGRSLTNDQIREIADETMKFMNLMEQYDKAPKLTSIVPKDVYANTDLAVKLSLSTDIIIEGSGKNVDQMLAVNSEHINPKYIDEMSVITIEPGEDILLSSENNLVSDLVKDAMKAGATFITDEKWMREGKYWEEFEQLAKNSLYEDNGGTGLWIKKQVDSPKDNRRYNEYRRDILTMALANTSTGNTVAHIISTTLKKGLGDTKNPLTLIKAEASFYRYVNSTKDPNLEEWMYGNGINLTNDDDISALQNFITRSKLMQTEGEFILDRSTDVSGKVVYKVVKAKAGALVAGQRVGRLVPTNRLIFDTVSGLKDKVVSPLLTISSLNLNSKDKNELSGIIPFDVEIFHKMVKEGAYYDVLKHMLKIKDSLNGDKFLRYFPIGGRNDKKEYNFLVEHPELGAYVNSNAVVGIIAHYTGQSRSAVEKAHEADMYSWAKDMLGITKDKFTATEREYYWNNRMNNLLYLRDFNMSKDANGNKDYSFLGKKGFLSGAADLNKRLQIILNTGAPTQSERFFANRLVEAERLGIDTTNLENKLTISFLDVKSSLAHRLGIAESLEDGNWFVLPEDLIAMAKTIGMPYSGGTLKPFVVQADEFGMMLGKMLLKIADPELQVWMRTNNVRVLADDNGTKQLGDRQTTEMRYNESTGSVEHFGELKSYDLSPESFNVVLSEISSISTLSKPVHATKQLFTNIGWLPKEIRADIFQTLFERSAIGDHLQNIVIRPILDGGDADTKTYASIRDNIDSIGIAEIIRALRSDNKELKFAVLGGIMSKNLETDHIDKLSGESEERVDIDKLFSADTNSGANELMKTGLDYALYDKYSATYIANAISKYVFNRTVRPYPGNAVKGVKNRGSLLSKYQIKPNEFMLGGNCKAIPISFRGEDTTFGDLYEQYKQNPNDVELADFIKHIGIQRIPQDNPSGFQVLQFRGFLDIASNEIVIHSNVKEATGGSDDDADSYYVWFGGRDESSGIGDGFKMSWLKELKKANDIYIDPETGAMQEIKKLKISTGEGAAELMLGKSIQEKAGILKNPSLIGAPGAQWQAMSSTAIARDMLSTVVTSTTVMRTAHTDAVDTNTTSTVKVKIDKYNYDEFTITPRIDIKDGEICSAAAITSVADPTNFDSIPVFRDDILFSLYFKVVDSYGNEVLVPREKRSEIMDNVMKRFLGPFYGMNSAMGKGGDYLETMSRVKSFDHIGSETILSQVARSLGSLDWDFGLIKEHMQKMPYLYELINQTMYKGAGSKTNMVMMEKLFNEITKHKLSDPEFDSLIETIIIDKKKINLSFSGKRYPNKMAQQKKSRALLELGLFISKIDDPAVARGLGNDLYIGEVENLGYYRNMYNKLIKAANIQQEDRSFTAIRKTVSDLMVQDIIDMTTYTAVRDLYNKNKAYYSSKEGKAWLIKIWNDVEDMKTSVSIGDNLEKAQISMDELNMQAASYRQALNSIDRDAFDIFMLGSWQKVSQGKIDDLRNQYLDQGLSKEAYFAKHGKEKYGYKMNETQYAYNLKDLINSTNYSQIGLSLSAIPDSSKKRFYAIPDKMLAEAGRITPKIENSIVSESFKENVGLPTDTDNGVLVSRNPLDAYYDATIGAYVDPVRDAEIKEKIRMQKDYLNSIEESLKEIDKEITISTAKQKNIVIKDVTEKQQMLWDQKLAGDAKVNIDDIDNKNLIEYKNLIRSITENLSWYNIGYDIPMEGIVRELFHKTTAKMTLADWKAFDNMLKHWRTPTFLQKVFGSKYGDTRFIKKLDYFLFPEAINKELMRDRIITMETRTAYIDKDGIMRTGTGLLPTHYLGKIQDEIGSIIDRATGLQQTNADNFRSEILPLTDALGEDGHKIYQLMVWKRDKQAAEESFRYYRQQARNATTTEERYALIEISDTHRVDARVYRDKIELLMANNRKTFNDDKIYNVNLGKEFKKMTYQEVRKALDDVVTRYNTTMSEMLRGNEETLKKYRITAQEAFKDILAKYPSLVKVIEDLPEDALYDTRKFKSNQMDSVMLNKDIETEIGIDGLTYLGRSEIFLDDIYKAFESMDPRTFDLYFRQRIKNWEKRQGIHTGTIGFDVYYPQLHEDPKERLARLLPRINKAKENYDNASTKDEKAKYLAEYMQLRASAKQGYNGINDQRIENDSIIAELAMQKVAAKAADEIESLDNAIRWEVTSQKVASQNVRFGGSTSHDTTPDSYIAYMDNVVGMLHKKMALVFSKMDVFEMERTQAMGEATESWVKFIKLYINDSLGNPSVLTKDIIVDPRMKLQGNLYTYLTDSEMSKTLYNLAKKVGILKPDGTIPEELQHLDLQQVIKFSQLEAQYEMTSLLAHPKSMAANLFGGTQMTIINVGFQNWLDARNPDYIMKNIASEMKDMREITKAVIESGIVAESFISETGVGGRTVTANMKEWISECQTNMMSGNFSVKDAKDLAVKYKIPDWMFDKAGWFMRSAEVVLRRDAFLAHYIYWHKLYGGALKGSYDKDGKFQFNPILLNLAKKGVKTTQFLYTAPYRPAIARTAFGKILTRFQLWTYNSVATRNELYQQAKIYGFAEGTEEMNRFERMMGMDLMSLALAQAFMFSIFDSTLPAPISWMSDISSWLFGDDEEKRAAFFGAYPYALAPLQVITPPIARMAPTAISGLVSGDWKRLTDYTVWTMFPFGRLARDLHKSYLNPKSFMDRMTGIPFQKFEGPKEDKEKYVTGGIV